MNTANSCQERLSLGITGTQRVFVVMFSCKSDHRAMARDESVIVNPEEFDPEHFLTPDGKVTNDELNKAAFGFGRRCG